MTNAGAASDPDAERVEAVRRGDPAAANFLYEKYYPLLFRIAKSMTRDHWIAGECAHDALAHAFLSITRFREGSSFRLWLLTITRNVVLNVFRSRTRRRELDLQFASPEVLARNAVICIREPAIYAAVCALPAREREIVMMHYYDDLPAPAIATRLAIPQGTVRGALSKARSRLRGKLLHIWAENS